MEKIKKALQAFMGLKEINAVPDLREGYHAHIVLGLVEKASTEHHATFSTVRWGTKGIPRYRTRWCLTYQDKDILRDTLAEALIYFLLVWHSQQEKRNEQTTVR